MKLCGAMDLHSNNNVTVLSNEKDEVVYRKRLPNDLKSILGQLAPYQSEIEGIVVESTYNWYWLVDGLMEQGYRVHLANTAAIQQYNGLKYTDDDSDARWLAHLLWLGVLPQGYIYPREQRPVRDLLRKRGQLVRQRTTNLLSNYILRDRVAFNVTKSLRPELSLYGWDGTVSLKWGWLTTTRSDWPLSRPLNRQLGDDLIRWYAHAVSQLRVGPPTGRATRSVNPQTLDAAWYRQFSGASRLARGGRGFPYLDHSTALILMGGSA